MSKVRGTKRKLQKIEQHLIDAANAFPTHFHAGVYTFKLPANQQFIAGLNQKGQKHVSSYLMVCAMKLKQLKPNGAYKIAVLLFPESFWRSELIIFEHEAVYREFFSRQNTWQYWREVENPADSYVLIYWTKKTYEEMMDDEQKQTFICYIER